MNKTEQIQWIADYLQDKKSLLFITGAGVSAESGLPTYRGIGGLYDDKLTKDDMPIEEALSGMMMRHNPALTWSYILEIEKACRGAKHNRAHEIIAKLEDRFERVCVLTQNIDGFHRNAGSRNVIDIHGDIHDLFCTECDYAETVTNYQHLAPLPLCPKCNALVRPKVVLFGEYLDMDKMGKLQQELYAGFDMVFSIGTTSVFPYISRPVYEANMQGIPTVEINPGTSEISDQVKIKFSAGAMEILTLLWEKLAR